MVARLRWHEGTAPLFQRNIRKYFVSFDVLLLEDRKNLTNILLAARGQTVQLYDELPDTWGLYVEEEVTEIPDAMGVWPLFIDAFDQ